MTQKLHHSQHPVFMNSPAHTATYIKRTFKNKVTDTLMSECYCDFDQYTAHVKQMVHIRPQRSHHYHLGICSTMVLYQGLYSRVNTLLSSFCSQEVITCFTSASIGIICQPGASQEFSEG